jgi:peptidoglycan/LPS O-acetylase OafA/YrhL
MVGQKSKLDALTGLRGVAACSVLLAHAIDKSFIWDGVRVFDCTSNLAYFGMSLFFVLSGFVIEYNYAGLFARERLSIATYNFFVARFARLYPLYILTIFLTMPIFPHPYLNVTRTIIYLTLTQSWFNLELAAFPPDWSISTEWFFYWAFIPLTFLIARVRRPMVALLTLCATAFFGIMTIFYEWHVPLADFVNHWFKHEPWLAADPLGWLLYFSPYLRVIEFIVGMLTAKCFLQWKVSLSPRQVNYIMIAALSWIVAVVLIVRFKFSFGFELSIILPNFIFAPAIAAVMLMVCRYDTALGRALSAPSALFLGEISYSIYIWSFVAMTVTDGLLHHAEQSIAAYINATMKLVLLCGLTIVMAYGSYLLIEVPSRRWLRQKLEWKPASRPAEQSSRLHEPRSARSPEAETANQVLASQKLR